MASEGRLRKMEQAKSLPWEGAPVALEHAHRLRRPERTSSGRVDWLDPYRVDPIVFVALSGGTQPSLGTCPELALARSQMPCELIDKLVSGRD